MPSGYERLEGDASHICRPPNWYRRWRDNVRVGAIWKCSCGTRYEFLPALLTFRMAGVYCPGGQYAPWWKIFPELKPPPKPPFMQRRIDNA